LTLTLTLTLDAWRRRAPRRNCLAPLPGQDI